MQELFEAVRAAAGSETWSRAVELVRHLAVTQEAADSQQVTCRVHRMDRAIPALVHLYPKDAEWDCDCDSRASCCEHVAASVIALRKAKAGGQPLPQALTSSVILGYRFTRHQQELKLERFVVGSDGRRQPLRMSLATAVSQHRMGLGFSPSQEDLSLDRALGQTGLVRPDQVLTILKLLVGHANVEFEGKMVGVSADPLRPRATVIADGEGFLVRAFPDPAVLEIVASFVALTEAGLAPLSATDYLGPKYERLVPERRFGKEELAILVTEILPEYKRWFVLDVQTDQLPEVTSNERPRVVVEVRQQGDQLDALATLVYGDPPIARVDRGKLMHLEGPVPTRKLDLEQRAISNLRQKLGLELGRRSVVTGKEARQLARMLDSWQGEIAGTLTDRWIESTVLWPTLSEGQLWPDFCAQSPEGVTLVATCAEAVRAYREGHSLVPLLEGGFAHLPTEWLKKHVALLERLLAAQPNHQSPHPPAYLAPTLVALHAALDMPLPAHLLLAAKLLAGASPLPPVELPKDLTATLRPYQREGVNWLALMKQLGLGALLADDMGLGKTLQVLAVIDKPTLIICPTTLISNWLAEIGQHRPKLRVSVYQGSGRELDDDCDITLTTYAILRLDSQQLFEKLWALVVLDEAQQIKNPESQVAQAAYVLRANLRIALTGTPLENRLDDLWSQLHFTNPGLLGTLNDFRARFVEPIRAGQNEVGTELGELIAPFVLRRTKEGVLPDLPQKIERNLYVDLEPHERELYLGILLAAQRDIVRLLAEGHSTMPALEALLRLRQVSSHPGLLPGHSAESSSKLEMLQRCLAVAIAEGHRSLVFSQWTTLLDLIEPHLRRTGIEFLRLDGSTTDRGRVVEQFQQEDGPKVFLLSLKAGGTGLNLTAADHVFLMDLWWNPAVEQQASDRTHRIGQTRPVFVHRLIAKDTVEERILALQAKKRELLELALEPGAHQATLSRQELLELLA